MLKAPEKTRWLMIRGLGREIAHWGKFREELERSGEILELLDLPGAGTEFRRKAPLSVAGMVEDLRARRSSDKRAGEPTGIIAISLGGMVALDWAARYPGEVSRLVVVNTSTGDIALPWQRLSLASLGAGVAFLMERGLERQEEITLRLTTCLRGEALRARAREWAEIKRLRPVSADTILRQVIAGAGFRLDDGALPRCPILVIRSLGDRLANPVCSERLAKKLSAELLTHPSGGHDLPLDAPEWLAENIARWEAGERVGSAP